MIKQPIRICQHFFTGDLCGFIRDRNREGHPLRPHKSVGEDVKSSGSGHTQLIADGTHLRLHLRIYTKSHGLIKAIRIIQIGDVIHIDDPLFAECNGVVRHIDYRKKRAKIELQLFNANCFCWVACDVINTNGKK